MFPGCQQVSLASPREEKKFENFRLLARRFFFLPRSFFSFALPLSLPLSLPLRLEGKEETSTSFSLALTLSTTLSWSSMSLESSDAIFSRDARWSLPFDFGKTKEKTRRGNAGKASFRALLIRGASRDKDAVPAKEKRGEVRRFEREKRGLGRSFCFLLRAAMWK